MTSDTSAVTRFDFDFAPSYRLPALLLGIMPATAWVEVDTTHLRVHYGLWRLSTALTNISSVSRSGGFSYLKTVGPPHLSFTDRGVTFATNGDDAVCLTFHRPVAGIDPTKRVVHPGATLTVADPEALIAHLRERGVA